MNRPGVQPPGQRNGVAWLVVCSSIVGAAFFAYMTTAPAAPAPNEPEFGVESGSATSDPLNSDAAGAPKSSVVHPPGTQSAAMPVGDLPGWRQIFTDDFNTAIPLGSFPEAVSSKWTAYPSPWKDTSGFGTYSPRNVVSVSNGVLTKSIHTADGVAMVGAISPRLPTPLVYGRFAVRYRLDPIAGYKMAWLLWPDSNDSERDGEIDFPEMNLDSTTVSAYSHRTDNTGPDDKASAAAPFSPGDWHVAVIEWSPKLVVFRFDGAEIGRTSERVSTAAMHWVLQTETALNLTAPPPPHERGNVQIDWVAAWAYDAATADTSPPSVSIAGPADGATVSATRALTATASDNRGVAGVQFLVDGVPIGDEATVAPFRTDWNTNLTTAGEHRIVALARDDGGNTTTSSPVTVTVDNGDDTTPPAVTPTPQAGATSFPVGAGLGATFNEAVSGVDDTSYTLRNSATAATIPSRVTYLSTANTSKATLEPIGNLSSDTRYTVTLTGAIKDSAGNPLALTTFDFITGPAPSAVPLSPLPGATGVSRSTEVAATSPEILDRVFPSTFALTSPSGRVVSATVAYDAATKVATLHPDAKLAPTTRYTASLSSGIKDLAGNPLTPLQWSFTTGSS